MVEVKFNARVRGRENHKGTMTKEITLSAVALRKAGVKLELGDFIKVTIEKIASGNEE